MKNVFLVAYLFFGINHFVSSHAFASKTEDHYSDTLDEPVVVHKKVHAKEEHQSPKNSTTTKNKNINVNHKIIVEEKKQEIIHEKERTLNRNFCAPSPEAATTQCERWLKSNKTQIESSKAVIRIADCSEPDTSQQGNPNAVCSGASVSGQIIYVTKETTVVP